MRRRGADEALLKADLARDLGNLVDTIDLDSVVDLSDMPYVKKSVLNYGLYDLTHVILDLSAGAEVIANLKRAMLQHEPRLSAETIVIEPATKGQDLVNQRIRFKVRADLICKPLDIPIEFVAELDSTSGKVVVSKPAGSA
jgi:type VI secretion system protein ImpF